MALELINYQTIVVMLFINHSQARCLEYDSLFRQAATHDPTLRWDTNKEDICVWAITQRHNTSTSQFQLSTSTFHDRLPISARLRPQSAESGKATAEGKEMCKQYTAGCCTCGEECIFTHVRWHPDCQGEHPDKVRQTSLSSSELSTPYDTLERELVNHPDKAWIQCDCSIASRMELHLVTTAHNDMALAKLTT